MKTPVTGNLTYRLRDRTEITIDCDLRHTHLLALEAAFIPGRTLSRNLVGLQKSTNDHEPMFTWPSDCGVAEL